MFINKNKRINLITESIINLQDDLDVNADVVLKLLDRLINIDKEKAFSMWEDIVKTGTQSFNLTQNLLDTFIEKEADKIFEMVCNYTDTFEVLSKSEEYNVESLGSMGTYLVQIEDNSMVIKFLNNALRTKGNKYSFLKDILSSYTFEDSMGEELLGGIIEIIEEFSDKVQRAKLIASISEFM
ncbi:MAG: hypothetical protein ACRCWG_12200 [Sarcina sp.]